MSGRTLILTKVFNQVCVWPHMFGMEGEVWICKEPRGGVPSSCGRPGGLSDRGSLLGGIGSDVEWCAMEVPGVHGLQWRGGVPHLRLRDNRIIKTLCSAELCQGNIYAHL